MRERERETTYLVGCQKLATYFTGCSVVVAVVDFAVLPVLLLVASTTTSLLSLLAWLLPLLWRRFLLRTRAPRLVQVVAVHLADAPLPPPAPPTAPPPGSETGTVRVPSPP